MSAGLPLSQGCSQWEKRDLIAKTNRSLVACNPAPHHHFGTLVMSWQPCHPPSEKAPPPPLLQPKHSSLHTIFLTPSSAGVFYFLEWVGGRPSPRLF